MSYAFNPALRVSSRPETPLDNQAQSTTGVHRRRFEVVDDDVMPLDYLIGVMLIKDKYSFVQYEPTESHKRSAGTKNAPVNQINMFVETLRANDVLFESAICTVTETDHHTVWLRIQLSDLSELSLEPLWMIKGRVQLFVKQRCIAIAIHEWALGEISLDRDAGFLVDSSARKRDAERSESSLSSASSPFCSKQNNMCEPVPKKSKVVPPCNATPTTRRHQTRYTVKTRFNGKDKKAHKYKTRNVSKTAAAEAKADSLPEKAVTAEPPLVFSFTTDTEASNRCDEMGSSGYRSVTRDEQPSCAVPTQDGTGPVQVDGLQCPEARVANPRSTLQDFRVRNPEPQLAPGDLAREDRALPEEKRRNCLLM